MVDRESTPAGDGSVGPAPQAKAADKNAGEWYAFRLVQFAGSVRLGIFLLILIIIASVLGMVITQYNVEGFRSFYAGLGEFERNLFTVLGLFDIYNSWYYTALLALLALNILLASIDRFPKTLRVVRNPNIKPSTEWIGARDLTDKFLVDGSRHELRDSLKASLGNEGFRRVIISEGEGRTVLFAESGAWNRLGAYPVHAALLTILMGGSISAMFGFTGEMSLSRGQTSDRIRSTVFREGRSLISFEQLPFSVRCADLEQKLIDPEGSLEVANSLDWITRLEAKDESGTRSATVSLNRPFDYRGYRFFHSTFVPIGKARKVVIEVSSDAGGSEKIVLAQGETSPLQGGAKVEFVDFRANMDPDRPLTNENSTSFENPAAILRITTPSGGQRTVFALQRAQEGNGDTLSTYEGMELRLLDFEPVSESHVLFVQYDPGVTFLYAGFLMLAVSLFAVFLFSHKRIWIAIEDSPGDRLDVTFGGVANRSHLAFRERFSRIVRSARTGQ